MNIESRKINEINNKQNNINFIYNYKFIKYIVAIVLLMFLIWMSYSRISNINETFVASLQKETEYELIDKNNLPPSVKFNKVLDSNVLIYKNEFPENLKVANKTSKDVMYVISSDSDIFKIKEDGYKGFFWDFSIILVILSLIYFGFIHYYKKILNDYNSIKAQLTSFQLEINKCQNIKDFIKNYDSILKNIREIPYIGNIWWEFCETLIIQREEPDKDNPDEHLEDNPNDYHENWPIEILKNTDQIEIYINSEVLIDKQTPKEIFDTIPGILTGLGLVGTFLAIAVALMGFDMGHIELSIQNLLGGLSIKFISSLAGIATSILFLFAKSNLFAELEYIIANEQNRLNHLFPRRTSESYLCHIWQQVETSQETLKKLENYAAFQEDRAQAIVEGIGTQISNFLKRKDENGIKEVLDEVAKKIGEFAAKPIQNAIQTMTTVMDDLKAIKKESSSKALETFLGELKTIFGDKFVGAMGNVGQESAQKFTQGIDNSISNISAQNVKLEELVNSIGQYIEKLQGFESRVEGNYAQLISNLDTTLSSQNNFIEQNKEYIQNVSDASSKISSTSSNLSEASEKIIKVSNNLQTNLDASEQTITTLKNGAEGLSSTLANNINEFDTKAKESMSELFSVYSDSIRKTCGDIQMSVAGLVDGQDDLKDSIDELNKNVDKLISERAQ